MNNDNNNNVLNKLYHNQFRCPYCNIWNDITLDNLYTEECSKCHKHLSRLTITHRRI